MSGILDVEGPVYRGLSRWAELIVLSLIWWLLMLPLVTAPVATNWLLHAARATRSGTRIPRPIEILRHVRRRFVMSWRLAGLQMAVVLLVAIALFGPSPGGWYGQLILITGSVVGCSFALVTPWSVAVLDQCHGARAALRTGYRMAVSQLSLAFLSAVAVAVGVVALVAAPGWIRVVVVLTVPGLVAALVSWLCDVAQARTNLSGQRRSAAPSPNDHRLREAIS